MAEPQEKGSNRRRDRDHNVQQCELGQHLVMQIRRPPPEKYESAVEYVHRYPVCTQYRYIANSPGL